MKKKIVLGKPIRISVDSVKNSAWTSVCLSIDSSVYNAVNSSVWSPIINSMISVRL